MSALGLTLLAAIAAAPGDEVRHIDASLEFDGELLDHRFVDPDGDGTLSLCVAVRKKDGTRELRLHALTRRGVDPEPEHSIAVLEDVLAYGFADVRDEPGAELLFMTRTGAYSYSLTKDGYRGNILRLATLELLYNVPDRRALPYWAYTVKGGAGDRDLVLLPGREALAVFGPRRTTEDDGAREAPDPYEVWALFDGSGGETWSPGDDEEGASMSGSGQLELQISRRDQEIFLSSAAVSGSLISAGESYQAPALVDLDGDGRRDLVLLVEDNLHIHMASTGGISAVATRVEALPEVIADAPGSADIEFADLNGDRYLDLLVRIESDSEGFENSEMRVLVLLGAEGRLVPEEPQQVFRFEAGMLRLHVADANADGRPDLLMRKFVLPSMLETVSGLEFELTHLAYFGQEGRLPFERKPDLNQTEVYGTQNIGEAIKNRKLLLDCDGDDIPDLVEVDVKGRIAIRRLKRESGFFSGESWELDENAWKRFDARGAVLSLDVLDVNADGLADIVSPGARSLTLLLSSRVR